MRLRKPYAPKVFQNLMRKPYAGALCGGLVGPYAVALCGPYAVALCAPIRTLCLLDEKSPKWSDLMRSLCGALCVALCVLTRPLGIHLPIWAPSGGRAL